MVHTRRMESGGTMPHIGTRHRTRRTLGEVEDEGSSSDIESDERPLRQPKNKPPPTRPKTLRRKFVFNNIKYSTHVRNRVLRSRRKRLSLDERSALTVYSSRKMHNDSDAYNGRESDEEIYSSRSRRSRHSRHMRSDWTRMQRRTALSLRPISQKSYADPHSPSHFNSDSEGAGVRRSKRKRKVQFENISWLADDQMHKVGYPNLHSTGYSEEDSRDAADITARDDIEISKRITRLSNGISKRKEVKTSKYLYEYDREHIPPSRRRPQRERSDRDHPERELRSRQDTNEKDNKLNVSASSSTTRLNGRLRSLKTEIKNEENDDNSNDSSKKSTTENGAQEAQQNNVEAEAGENADESKVQESSESGEVPGPKTRTRSSFASQRNCKESESSSSESEEELPSRKGYSLRDRKPPPPMPPAFPVQSSVLRNHGRRRRFTRRRKSSSSSSDSSSDDDVRHDKYSKTPKSPHSKADQRMKSGAGGSKIIPIGPETLDGKVRFSSIGGLDSHIQCLKEMILLPMMYPEVFRQFQIQPPRGVLFHGPPGTGKTLIARALANECSFGSKKVSFFMRKGADLLSKWIGESEKQLRLLFSQAAEMKPSIIFFDELDGLAPVRSSRQDQVHASIVSTLLALMDGLDNRGEVIVIGATNRIDAIDPALRRPGRFDRELYFPLPARKEREEILNVHVSQWARPPSPNLLSYLAENAIGYCGSDLRALCSEAVIQSFRRTYPQVYNSEYRLQLNPENVKVEKIDFLRAKSLLVPASQRIAQGLGKKMLPVLEPILNETLKNVFALLEQSFPHGLNECLSKVKLSANVRPAQLLLTGEGPEHGQTQHLAPAMLYKMEHISAYVLDFATLYRESGRSPEEACIQVFCEARRNVPSIIYVPTIDKMWALVSDTVKVILISQLKNLDSHTPLLFLATADTVYNNLPEDLQNVFSKYRKEVYQLNPPSTEQRRAFFKPLIVDNSLKQPRPVRQRPKTPPPLPRAPTPPPSPLTEDQARKLYEKEEHTLRELRIFLRDMCKKLANNKLFYMFTKPVDTEEVPDYTTIIKQPMDLETMMMKVDFHRYECAKDFLTDIELICHNALEYNPAKTSVDKQIRHRACSLRDYAYTLIKNEMDTDFEDRCQDIAKKRKLRKASVSKYLPAYIKTPDIVERLERIFSSNDADELSNNFFLDNNMDHQEVGETSKQDTTPNDNSTQRHSPNRKRRLSSWRRGYVHVRKRRKLSKQMMDTPETVSKPVSSGDESKENNPISNSIEKVETIAATPVPAEPTTPLNVNCDTSCSKVDVTSPLQSPKRRLSDLMSPSELLEDPLDFDDVDQALNETEENAAGKKPVECSVHELEKVLDQAVRMTAGYSLQALLDIHHHLNRITRRYCRTHIRTSLPKELLKELSRFKKEGVADSLNDSTTSSKQPNSNSFS